MSNPNYQEAFEELQQIVSDLEDGQVTVDELSEKVSRAALLIKICKSKLTQAEQNVQEILESMDRQDVIDEPEFTESTSETTEAPGENAEEFSDE